MDEKIVKLGVTSPDPNIFFKAAAYIKNGGVVVFPTRCLYGLGVDALNYEAVEKVFTIKRRNKAKPLLVLIQDLDNLHQFVRELPPVAQELIKRFWPGKLTLVLKAKKQLPQGLTSNNGKIGIRLPAHPVAAALVNTSQCAITGTSANISGDKGCCDVNDLSIDIIEKADMILDTGALRGGSGSTVVDVTDNTIQIIREGVITRDQLT